MTLKWLTPPAVPAVSDLHLKGTSGAPITHGLSMVTVRPDGIASYETLYSFLDVNGQPVVAAYPGTYGILIAARSARGGRY